MATHLIEVLHHHDWHVIALDHPRPPKPNTPSQPNTPHENLSWIDADITDLQQCENAVPEGLDALFHLAEDTSLWKPREEYQERLNLTATKNLLEVARQKQVRRFVFNSHLMAYGIAPRHFNETTPSTAPHVPIVYSQTKFQAEQAVKKAATEGLDAVVLNPSHLLGQGRKHAQQHWIAYAKQSKHLVAPPGRASWSDVGEVAKACFRAYEVGKTGENYLLGGVEASYLEVLRQICHGLNKKPPRIALPAGMIYSMAVFSEAKGYLQGQEPFWTPEKALLFSTDLVCDSSKAERELGYSAVPLQDMLRQELNLIQT